MVPKLRLWHLFRQKLRTNKKSIAKAQKLMLREPSVDGDRLAAASTIYTDLKESLKVYATKRAALKTLMANGGCLHLPS
jgi:hypothetical protein